MLVILYAFQSGGIQKLNRGKTLEICSDNQVVLWYLQKRGGTKSKILCDLSLKIWNIWLTGHTIPYFKYVTSSENFDTDSLSRFRSASIEWTISVHIRAQLFVHFGEPDVDLFASRSNRIVPTFVSWTRDIEAYAVDAFSVSWNEFCRPYAFPPVSLISAVLDKLYYSGNTVLLLVFPVWPSQPWFASLLHMLCSEVRCFSAANISASGRKVPKWTMGSALVTSDTALIRAFHQQLPALCPPQEDHPHGSAMTPSGFTLMDGVEHAVWIPVMPLCPR